MDKFDSLKALNQEIFHNYEKAIANSLGQKEEKLKIECESINHEYFKKLGIDLSSLTLYEEGDLTPSQEYYTKRPDALYSNIRIEYKAVGVLDNNTKKDEFIEKVKREYIERARVPMRAIGILFDGNHIITIKKMKGTLNWIVIEQTFNERSLFEMLLLLINADKKKLTPENLNNDFSPEMVLGKQLIRLLFTKLNKTNNTRTIMLYKEWDKSFSSIYKNAFDNPKIRKDFINIMKGFEINVPDHSKFLFVLHTYYAFIVKLIASEAASTVAHELIGSYISTLTNSEHLREDLAVIEDGGIFKQSLKIENFIESNFFSWYLEEWDKKIEDSFKEILKKLVEYNFATFIEIPEETKDLLKRFYQLVVPQRIRHDLGEYYTPDWLAQHLIRDAGFDGNPQKKILDPACGSGTFLVELIKVILISNKQKLSKKQIRELITNNIIGFDINPIAVLTARTNYLLALSPVLRDIGFDAINIPVFLTDSIILPKEVHSLQEKTYVIQTTKGNFFIPVEIVNKQIVDQTLSDMEERLTDYSEEEFQKIIKKKYNLKDESVSVIGKTFKAIKELNEKNENAVWTKIIKNSFAPIFRKNQFDYVIGNPPWVNWEFLSDEYSELLRELSKALGIFVFTGKEARHGHAKDDLAAIFTYASAKYYMKDDAKLAFLIKPLFQNAAGKGFRQFKFKDREKTTSLKVKLVEDLSEIKPFEGAQNETAIIVLNKNKRTKYPIKFIKWKKRKGEIILQNELLKGVYQKTVRIEQLAQPSPGDDLSNGWSISNKGEEEQFNRLRQNFLGKFSYPIRQGLNFGISSVYWFDIKKRLGNKVRIKNGSERSKKFEVNSIEATIDRELVFPILKSRNIKKWGLDSYIYALVPQKKTTEDNENEIKVNYFDTYEYLKRYRKVLEEDRKSVWFKGKPFYKIYGLGDYSWAPFKVAWVNLGYKPEFVVISKVVDKYLGTKQVLAEHVVSIISEREKDGKFITEDEAHYICAIMNSEPIRAALDTITQKGKSGLPNNIIEQVRLDRYESSNNIHKKLSELSKKAHANINDRDEIRKIQSQINNTVLFLYSKKNKKLLEAWFVDSSDI